MILYNFTNHKQSKHQEFFEERDFSEVTRPLHPHIYPHMSERFIEELVRRTIFQDIVLANVEKDSIHILVAGNGNVVFYALKYIQYWNDWKHNQGLKIHSYYTVTERLRDENNRFVLKPVQLREYRTGEVTEINIY